MTFDLSTAMTAMSELTRLESNPMTEVAYAATQTKTYTTALSKGEITKAEFDDLMADLKIDQMVATTALEEEAMSALTSIVSDLKTILMTLASAAI